MRAIRTLRVSGSYYDIGYAHGEAYHDAIHHFARERVALVEGGKWSGGPLPREEVLAIAEACVEEHAAYAPDLMEEVRGMADATGLTLGELMIVGGFTDFVDTVYSVTQGDRLPYDDCTAFIVPDDVAEGAGFFGQTWDMHATAEPYVLLLHVEPEEDPAALTFTITGCVGMVGMNAHGIAVGINNLLGADGQIGVTWPFVVRKILQQEHIEAALACITEAKLAGAHNYLLFDGEGTGYNVEAMATTHHITRLEDDPLVHTNHCLLPETLALSQARLPGSQRSSEARLADATQHLRTRPIRLADVIALTQDEGSICHDADPEMHVSTCGAVIMRPKTGDFWAVWGKPSERPYTHFTL